MSENKKFVIVLVGIFVIIILIPYLFYVVIGSINISWFYCGIISTLIYDIWTKTAVPWVFSKKVEK